MPTTRMQPKTRDLVLLGVAVAAVSTSAPLIRAAAAPALAIAFWRTMLAVPVTGLAMATRDRARAGTVDGPMVRESTLAGMFLAGHFAAWVPSLSFTTVASSVALVCLQPVWAAGLARLRGEIVTSGVWYGIAVALAGVVVLTGVDLAVSPRALFGDLLALVGGMLAAAYVTVGARVRQRTSTAVYATLCYSAAAVLLLAVCLVGRQSLMGYAGTTWLALAGLAVGPQLLGHTVINQVLRTTSPTVVSVAILFEIVGAAILAWAFFGEVPPASAVPATLLICTGIVWVVRATSQRPPLASPPG